MKLAFRLLALLLTWKTRGRCDPLGPSRITLRVLPTDIDVLRHVNNGVYFSLMDVARADLWLRSGIVKELRGSGWYPVVGAETMRFRRSLKLFDRFVITSRVIGWDEKAFLFEHTFLRRFEVVAEAVVRVRVLARGGRPVPTAEVLNRLGESGPPPPLPGWVELWNVEHGGAPITRSGSSSLSN